MKLSLLSKALIFLVGTTSSTTTVVSGQQQHIPSHYGEKGAESVGELHGFKSKNATTVTSSAVRVRNSNYIGGRDNNNYQGKSGSFYDYHYNSASQLYDKSGLHRYDTKPPSNSSDTTTSTTYNGTDATNDPKTVDETKKISEEKNAKELMISQQAQMSPMTHSKLRNVHTQSQQFALKTSRNDRGDTGKRALRGNAQTTIHRRTMQQCNGIKKIVQCKDDVEESVCKQQLVDAGVEVVADMPKTAFFAICVDSQIEANLVAQITNVEGVEDDPPRTLSYVPGSVVQRMLQGQTIPYGVNLVNAPDFWDRYDKRGDGVKVCVIDTGLRTSHEDIEGISSLTGTNDNDLVTPWDEDTGSHGTHVTGTIAAQDNSAGVIGVAPDAGIHVIRVFDDSGQFSASSLVEAMNACGEAGAKIISMSLGGTSSNIAEQWAVNSLQNQGILLVAASGNDGNGANAVEYPAGYEAVMSVGALDESIQIASFSTHNTAVDIAGPGVAVLSTTANNDRSYAEYSGTSMATPHVAAVAALLWSQFPQASVEEIRTALQESASDSGACGKDRLFGHGLVDATAAADYLENGSSAPEQSGCIDVKVELLTDDWGAETSYVITPKSDGSDIAYRGGPYPNNQRSTYTDNIQLQDGCYNIELRDSYGDGNSDAEYGQGSLKVTYSGSVEVDFGSFKDDSEIFEFGNCGGNDPSPTPAPVPSPTSAPVPSPTDAPVPSPTDAPVESPTDAPFESPTPAPVPGPTPSPVSSPTNSPVAICGDGIVDPGEECDDGNLSNNDECTNSCEFNVCGDGFVWSGVEDCDDGNAQDGDGCDSNCEIERPESTECDAGLSQIDIILQTDRWSRSENELYFFDTAAPDDEWIWVVELWEFRGNAYYEGTACVDLANCYEFYFFDGWGDGLSAGGLTLLQDGVTVLDVSPHDIGTPVGDGSAKEYWHYTFGACE